MKSYLFIVLIGLMVSSCAPSERAIQTALAETQSSWTPTPAPTKTKIPAMPDQFDSLSASYILELGVCLSFIRDTPGDPKNAGCTAIYRETVDFVFGQNAVTASLEASPFYPYCALYTMSGKLVSKNFAPEGSSEITCTISDD